jgi:galactonate dehydratase
MKITGVETFTIDAAPGNPLTRNWLFVKVLTDSGIHGWGESSLEWREGPVAAAVHEMTRQLVGKNPLEIERLTQGLDLGVFWRGGAVLQSAVSGINQALWDIFGKAQNLPVYQLLGGACRDRIRVYVSVIRYYLETEQVVADALSGVARGFTALKGPPMIYDRTGPLDLASIRRDASKVGAVRQAVGDTIDLMVDCQGAPNPASAILFADAVAPYNLLFIEEPIPSDNADAMATVARSTKTPIASGERLFSPGEFRPFLEKQALAIIQPDTCHAGGISAIRKLAAMAEPYYTMVAPHNACGPVGTAAALHLATALTNFLIQEIPDYALPMYDRITEHPVLSMREGFADLPHGPGLGIELREDVLVASPPGLTPLRPFAFADGSWGGWL